MGFSHDARIAMEFSNQTSFCLANSYHREPGRQRAARQCDLMLVAGSSLEVLPVAGLPLQALDHGAHLIVINNAETYVNVRADIVITENVATILPEIIKRAIHG